MMYGGSIVSDFMDDLCCFVVNLCRNMKSLANSAPCAGLTGCAEGKWVAWLHPHPAEHSTCASSSASVAAAPTEAPSASVAW